MSRLKERIYETLQALAAEEGVSDPVTPQIIQSEGQIGQAHDSAKFAVKGLSETLEPMTQMVGDAKAFVNDLLNLSRLPAETRQAFERNDDGFAMTRIQDVVASLEDAEKHIKEAHNKLTDAVKSAERYRADILNALKVD